MTLGNCTHYLMNVAKLIWAQQPHAKRFNKQTYYGSDPADRPTADDDVRQQSGEMCYWADYWWYY